MESNGAAEANRLLVDGPAGLSLPRTPVFCDTEILSVKGIKHGNELHLTVLFPGMEFSRQQELVERYFSDADRYEAVPEERGLGYTVLQGWYVVYRDPLGAIISAICKRTDELLSAIEEE